MTEKLSELDKMKLRVLCFGLVVGALCGAMIFAPYFEGRVRTAREDDEKRGMLFLMDLVYKHTEGSSSYPLKCDNAEGNPRRGTVIIRCGDLTAVVQNPQAQTIAVPASAPQSQDPAVQVLNALRPGLGTATGALVGAIQKAQAAKAAADQQAMMQALQREQTEKHCPSGNCAACPDGWKLFSNPQETYCVPAAEN